MHEFPELDKYPEFMTTQDLVELGLWPAQDSVYQARRKGLSPDYIRIGKKVFYPKNAVRKFLQKSFVKCHSN